MLSGGKGPRRRHERRWDWDGGWGVVVLVGGRESGGVTQSGRGIKEGGNSSSLPVRPGGLRANVLACCDVITARLPSPGTCPLTVTGWTRGEAGDGRHCTCDMRAMSMLLLFLLSGNWLDFMVYVSR